MAENQLQILVKESGLETTKAKKLLESFQKYFAIAEKWEIKAKSIVVTNASQESEMKMAREGRLFLRDERIALEKSRIDLKEQSLRESRAIDGIANVLKALIVPIEKYLEKQEKFVQIQAEIKKEALRREVEKRIEEERIAKEKADAKEQERIRLENVKLKEKLAKEREKARKEKEFQDKKFREAQAAQKKKVTKERAKAEEDRKEQEAILAAERAKAETKRKAAEEKASKEKEKERAKAEAERKEKERLAELLKNQIECPHCHKKFQLNRS